MSLIEMTVTGSILILAVLAIRAVGVCKLPKKALILMWGLCVLRLLMPISIALPILPAEPQLPYSNSYTAPAPTVSQPNVYKGQSTVPEEITVPEESATPDEIVTPSESAAPQNPVQIPSQADTSAASPMLKIEPSIIANIWLAGFAALALYFAIGYARATRRYRQSLPVESEFVKAWQTEHEKLRKISIRYSDMISSPLTYGLLHPVILLPKNTDFEEKERLSYILEHEYAHIRHLDALAKLVAALVLCLHWFNPLVWVMYILYNRDMELWCDECVLRRYGKASRASYAQLLIEMAETRAESQPLLSHFGRNCVQERIVSIMKFKKTTIFSAMAAVLLIFAITVTVVASAINPVAKEAKSDVQGDDSLAVTLTQKDAGYQVKKGQRIATVYQFDHEPTDNDKTLSGGIMMIRDNGDLVYYRSNKSLCIDNNCIIIPMIVPEDGICVSWASGSYVTVEKAWLAFESSDTPYLFGRFKLDNGNYVWDSAYAYSYCECNVGIGVYIDGSHSVPYLYDGIQLSAEHFNDVTMELNEFCRNVDNDSGFETPNVEWWTYDEYKAWLENEKVELQGMIGEKGWTGGRGDFVWTQEIVDETIAMYEGILEQIKNGLLVSKTVDGSDDIMLAQGRDTIGSEEETEALKVKLSNRLAELYEQFNENLRNFLFKSGKSTDNITKEVDQPVYMTDKDIAKDSILHEGEAFSWLVDRDSELPDITEYEQYGISVDADNRLLYNGERVRYFCDGAEINHGEWSIRQSYYYTNGTVDVFTVREPIANADGSFDWRGKLLGLRKSTQEEFDRTSFAYAGDMQYAATDYSSDYDYKTGYLHEPHGDNLGVAETTESFGDSTTTGKTFSEMFEKYSQYGIEYRHCDDGLGDLYLNGEAVSDFWDISPNGTFTFESTHGGNCAVVCDYDEYGKLCGVHKIESEHHEENHSSEHHEDSHHDKKLTADPTVCNFLWPVPDHYTITSHHGPRWNTEHNGIDIAGAKVNGADIVAASSGEVIAVSNDCAHNYGKHASEFCDCGDGLGNYCVIDHGNGYTTHYAKAAEITVTVGQKVSAGDVIGKVGSTGQSTGAHLHFEIRYNGESVDPEDFNLIKQ